MADEKLQQLQQKYVSVLNVINRHDFKVQNMHVQDDKLFIRAQAPNQEAKNQFWDQVKKVDPNNKDFAAEITVAPAQQQASKTPSAGQKAESEKPAGGVSPSGGGSGGSAARTYTVQKGDTLSKISKEFYGKANLYMKIFEANRDQLKDPDLIYPGQVLKIPE